MQWDTPDGQPPTLAGATDAERAAQRKLECEAAAGRNVRSVAYILAELDKEDPDLFGVAEAWAEISEADQMLIWLAPTKGGIFTTAQRRTIKECLPNLKAET